MWIDEGAVIVPGDRIDGEVAPCQVLLQCDVARGVDAGVFSEFAANGMLQTLLSAGGESTTSLLGNAVRILAEQPELQQHLREHLDLIPAFVEEAVRLEAPFRYLMRSVPLAVGR